MSRHPITLGEQIACVEREIVRRRDAFPFAVRNGKLSAAKAEQEQDRMVAVLATLRETARRNSVEGYVSRHTPGGHAAKIVDAETGETIDRVVEAHTGEGWFIQAPDPGARQPYVRVERAIRIVYPEGATA